MNKRDVAKKTKECEILRQKINIYESRLNSLHTLRQHAQTCEELSAIYERFIECNSKCMRCYEKLTKLEKEIYIYETSKNRSKKEDWLEKIISQ